MLDIGLAVFAGRGQQEAGLHLDERFDIVGDVDRPATGFILAGIDPA
jgi:hypothetical protein